MDFSQWEQRTGSDNSNVVSDLSDFSDLPGPSNTNMLASPQTFYSAYTSPGYHLFQAPYAQMPYGQSWPTTSVPLSNYSSLNGATSTSNSQTQAQPQPQHSPQQHHMSIDPMLSMNGAATSSMQSPFPPPSTFSPAQQQQQQPQPQQHPHPPSQQQQQQQMQAHPLPSQAQTQTQSRSAYFNPHIMYNSYYHQQTSSAPQGTLSPQALHSPTASIMSIMPTAAFYSQSLPQTHIAASASSPVASSSQNVQQYINAPPTVTQPPSTPTPEEREERKREFLTKIRPLLQSSAFTGAGAVRELTDRIAEYGISEVDAATRLEIVAAIRDGAGNHYFRAWSENTTAIDITREWIKAAAKGNNPPLIETTMPLLHLIDRLPFDLHSLMDSKLGKIIKKLVKDESSSAIRDLASNLERKWRNLLAVATEGAPSAQENNRTDDPSKKKRKLEPASSGTKAVPLKKAAVGTSASVKPVSVKKEPIVSKVPAVTVKDAAKADSSFFSAPKSKVKKLPSFTKKPPPTAAGQRRDDGVAQPSAINPFEEALKSMKVARKDSPAAPTPPPMGSAGPSTSSSGPSDAVTPLRRKKSVTWAPDDRLESVRFIERAIYDDDPADGTHVTHSLRDLDRGEGAALHAHLFEEAIDWAEPLLVELPQEPDGHQRLVRGIDSQEKSTQEEREKTALSAVYMSLNQIPESPAEPATVLTEEESDRELKHMSVGADLDALFQWTTEPVPAPPPAVSATVAELVGQLAMGSLMDTSGPGLPSNLPSQLDVNGAASAQLAAVQGLLPKEQLQQLLAQLSTSVAAAASGASVPNAYAQPTYDGWAPDYGVTYPDGDQQRGWSVDGRGRGRGGFRGGRGRGRGEDGGYRPYSKRKPCSFYAAGRCKYGDQCDFAHDVLAPMEQ